MFHKNTDDLSDLKCIFNNHGHGVNKKKISILVWKANEDKVVKFWGQHNAQKECT